MARKDKPFREPYKDWASFVNAVICVFCRALDMIQVTEKMKKHEDDITDYLYPELEKVNFELKAGINNFARDAKIGAKTKDELGSEHIRKKPDIATGFTDPMAKTIEKYAIKLHIECKCVGSNRSSSWNLNKNYIDDGINRFDCLTHKYGEYVQDGIMVGYIISSTKPDIQKQINESLPANIEKLDFRKNDKVENIATKFKRKTVEPFDFTLHHIWADFA
jgi:hypothetical protein